MAVGLRPGLSPGGISLAVPTRSIDMRRSSPAASPQSSSVHPLQPLRPAGCLSHQFRSAPLSAATSGRPRHTPDPRILDSPPWAQPPCGQHSPSEGIPESEGRAPAAQAPGLRVEPMPPSLSVSSGSAHINLPPRPLRKRFRKGE
ncbi:MAG: hypothetical protein HDS36_00975 [Bacteroides sp.]|nr:hypothetical protein [Bacteroides sp.]